MGKLLATHLVLALEVRDELVERRHRRLGWLIHVVVADDTYAGAGVAVVVSSVCAYRLRLAPSEHAPARSDQVVVADIAPVLIEVPLLELPDQRLLILDHVAPRLASRLTGRGVVDHDRLAHPACRSGSVASWLESGEEPATNLEARHYDFFPRPRTVVPAVTRARYSLTSRLRMASTAPVITRIRPAALYALRWFNSDLLVDDVLEYQLIALTDLALKIIYPAR